MFLLLIVATVVMYMYGTTEDTVLPRTMSVTTFFEPRHEISNNVVCATSKGSDQPAHTRSLIRAFASRLHIL